MPTQILTADRHRNAALYAAGLMLVLIPVLDLVQGVLPLKPGDVEWRFGAVGLLSGFLVTPILGLLLISYGANGLGHRASVRAVAILELVAATAFVFLTVAFLLDAVQLRRQVPPDNKTTFDYTVIRAVLKYGISIVVYAWLGLAALWDLKPSGSEGGERRGRTPLVRSSPASEPSS